MALLKRGATGELHSLTSSHIVGRSPGSNLHLAGRLVSSIHAEVLWSGSAWELRDLGSRNGTFVGTRRLESGERVTIRRGTKVAFGYPEELFELVDDGPPSAAAVDQDGQRQEAEDGMLILPDSEHPVLTVFEEGGGIWVVESNDGSRQRVSHGDDLHIDTQVWRLGLPTISESTWQPDSTQLALRRLTMRFAVSRDEEHVEVSLLQGNQAVALPPRAHDYLLLTLARARLAEQACADVPEAEAGWIYVPDLLDMLKTNETAFNVAIYRARRELARAKVYGANELFERRPSPRRIRLGVQRFEVITI